jgi:hypothetical protein
MALPAASETSSLAGGGSAGIGREDGRRPRRLAGRADRQARPPQMSARRSRLLALAALGAALLAVVVAVSTVRPAPEASGKDAPTIMQELNAANGALGERLEALVPGASPRAAQAAARSTAALTRRLDGEVDNAEFTADTAHAALQAELLYLDAVGSTLNNPAGELREVVGERAQGLRDALRRVPGGDHHAVRGGTALVAYSRARAGR